MGKKTGFALWEKELLREIAKLGGKSVHQKGTAHVFDAQSSRLAAEKSARVRRERKAARQRQLEMFEGAEGDAGSMDRDRGAGSGDGDAR